MKKFLIISVCISLLISSCASVSGTKKDNIIQENKTIAVLPLKCNSENIGSSISDHITEGLISSQFDILERSQINHLILLHLMPMAVLEFLFT